MSSNDWSKGFQDVIEEFPNVINPYSRIIKTRKKKKKTPKHS